MAPCISELPASFCPQDVSIGLVCDKVMERTQEVSIEKYRVEAVRRSLDLLFYCSMSTLAWPRPRRSVTASAQILALSAKRARGLSVFFMEREQCACSLHATRHRNSRRVGGLPIGKELGE